MAADLTYRLIVDMSSKGSLAPQLGQLESRAKGIDTSFKGLGSALKDSIAGAVGQFEMFKGLGSALKDSIAGAVGQFEKLGDTIVGIVKAGGTLAAMSVGAGLAHGVMHLNNELEKTTISLAAIFNAQGVTSGINEGLSLASSTIKEMRRDAAKLPGEFEDLLLFFKLGATPGFQAGATIPQLEKLSAQAMAAAASVGVQMDQAAREFAQLLQGRAGAHNVFGTMLGFTGEAASKFNAMTGADRLKEIEKQLAQYQEAIDAFENSFDSAAAAMTGNIRQFMQRATAPLFDRVKEQLRLANKWFEDHELTVEKFADKIGQKLQRAFDFGQRKIAEWWPAIKAFTDHAAQSLERIWERSKPILAGLEKQAKAAAASEATMPILGAGALAYGGLKIGGALAPVLGPLFSGLRGLGGELAAVGAGLGGAELAAAGAGLGGIASSAAAAGIAAGALAAALAVAGGALHAMTDEASLFHEEASSAAKALRKETEKTFKHTSEMWAKIGPIVISGLDMAGAAWLRAISVYMKGVSMAVESMDKLIDKAMLIGGIDVPRPQPDPFADTAIQFGFKRPDADPGERKTKPGAGGGHGGTHIQKVEIVVTSNQDPNRIARLTAERLMEISRHPTSSPRVRNWSAARPR